MTALPYILNTVLSTALGMAEQIATRLRHPAAGKLNNQEARAMLIAIGLQESRFVHRLQIGGPARGFWQFEKGGGVRGVRGFIFRNPHSSELAKSVLLELGYGDSDDAGRYEAVAHNDILACLFARTLLWTLPQRLPQRGDHEESWRQYIDGWRPGKPHRQTWNAFYDQAWGLV